MSLSPSVGNTRTFLNEINDALYVNKLVSLRSSSLFSLLVHSAAYAHHLFTFSPFNDCLARFLSYTLRKCNEGTSFFHASEEEEREIYFRRSWRYALSTAEQTSPRSSGEFAFLEGSPSPGEQMYFTKATRTREIYLIERKSYFLRRVASSNRVSPLGSPNRNREIPRYFGLAHFSRIRTDVSKIVVISIVLRILLHGCANTQLYFDLSTPSDKRVSRSY